MIYNWTPFVDGQNKIELSSIDVRAAKSLAPDDWKPAADKEYFTAQVTNTHLVDPEGRYHHPSSDDVFVFGEDTYGLDHVVESTRRGARWDFKLLVHKLVKQVYAHPKSFGAPYKSSP